MGAPDIKADAQRVFQVLKSGGIAIVPASMGYTIMTANPSALEKVFLTKKRGSHKRHAMGGSYELHKAVHVLSEQNAEIVRCLVQDFDLPLAVVAPYDPNHPVVKNIDAKTVEAATENGTLAMLINAGRIVDEIAKLTSAAGLPFLGSSANISGSGTKYVLEDIQKELIDIADIVLDYGLVKWGSHGRSSTMIDFSKPVPEVIRIGVGYDVIKDHGKRFWGIEFPNDPGKASLPSGHLKILPPLKALDELIDSRRTAKV